jgi:hypothetical protein
VALKKPSDLFNKKESSVVFQSSEISSNITETYDRFRDNLDRVNVLSEQIEYLSQQLSEKMTRTDLENAMYSQLMILDENFKSIQNLVRGLNKDDLKQFKVNISNLTEIVGNLVENELPKYKKQITNNEIRIGEKFDVLKEKVEENVLNIKEDVDTKVNSIAEIIDTNLEYFNNQLQETSTEVKKTTDTYNKLSKIVESKVSKENEKLEEYSQVIQSLHEAFIELENSLQEESSNSQRIVEKQIESYKNEITSEQLLSEKKLETYKNKLEISVDNRLENYQKELRVVKADVVINEQHIKNVDKYLKEHHQELVELKEEVFSEIGQIPVGDLQENINRLEKKIDFIKETYSKIEPEVIVKEVIREGLLNEPPNAKNSDPLTPLDQNFVTLNQLQEHYRLFINRIQQQLSTIGGGGETRLKYLDDIVGIATNASAYDGKFLKYNHSLGKFEFSDVISEGELVTTSSLLSDSQSENLDISGYRRYVLMSLVTSHDAWIRLYSDIAARTADETRTISTDPIAGSGVIAEFITTGNQIQRVTPFIFGGNLESIPNNNLYLRVTNLSGITTAINISITLIKLET